MQHAMALEEVQVDKEKLRVGGNMVPYLYSTRYVSEHLCCQCHRSWAAAGSTLRARWIADMCAAARRHYPKLW